MSRGLLVESGQDSDAPHFCLCQDKPCKATRRDHGSWQMLKRKMHERNDRTVF